MNSLLDSEVVRSMLDHSPRQLVTDAVREVLATARDDPPRAPLDPAAWGAAIRLAVASRERRSLRPVLNATGVVLHTNLGRAPLASAALDAIRDVAHGYSNLEYDLERGERGSRYSHCVALLRELTGADDAIVVNNGAAALVLALNTFAAGRDAIVSRGELVEIGGSFRVPDIMARSGARLVEVGTTNRTHANDYRRALSPNTGVIVKVHQSNFAIEGFVAAVGVQELAALAADQGVPVLHDLGSGLFIPLERFGLRGEPVVSQAVRDGATIVTMSGDKLLGSAQAGIALGTADAIARMRENPLTRALRVDKLTLAALEATLALYRDPERAIREIPALAMLVADVETIRSRARELCAHLAAAGVEAEVIDSDASVGGGAFPTARIPSAAIALRGDAPELEARLRGAIPPVIGRVASGCLLLDLRTIPADADDDLLAIVVNALA